MEGVTFAIPQIGLDILTDPVKDTMIYLNKLDTQEKIDAFLLDLNSKAEGFIISFVAPGGTVASQWASWKTMYIEYYVFSKAERDDISEDKMKILITALTAFASLQMQRLRIGSNTVTSKKSYHITTRL